MVAPYSGYIDKNTGTASAACTLLMVIRYKQGKAEKQ